MIRINQTLLYQWRDRMNLFLGYLSVYCFVRFMVLLMDWIFQSQTHSLISLFIFLFILTGLQVDVMEEPQSPFGGFTITKRK